MFVDYLSLYLARRAIFQGTTVNINEYRECFYRNYKYLLTIIDVDNPYDTIGIVAKRLVVCSMCHGYDHRKGREGQRFLNKNKNPYHKQ